MNNFANIFPQIVQRGLTILRETNPMLASIATEPRLDQRVRKGGTVRIRVPIVPTAQDWDPATGFTPAQDSSYAYFDVTINEGKWSEFNINIGEGTSDQDVAALIEDHAAPLAASIAEAIYAELYALITPANFPNATVVADGSADYDTFLNLGATLDDRKLAQFGRFGVLTPGTYAEVAGDPRVATSNQNSGVNTIQSGVLSDVAGFKIGKSTQLSGAATTGLRGFVGNKESLGFASVIPTDLQAASGVPSNALIRVVSDPASGINVWTQAWYEPSLGKLRAVTAVFFGVAAGRAASLERLVVTGGQQSS